MSDRKQPARLTHAKHRALFEWCGAHTTLFAELTYTRIAKAATAQLSFEVGAGSVRDIAIELGVARVRQSASIADSLAANDSAVIHSKLHALFVCLDFVCEDLGYRGFERNFMRAAFDFEQLTPSAPSAIKVAIPYSLEISTVMTKEPEAVFSVRGMTARLGSASYAEVADALRAMKAQGVVEVAQIAGNANLYRWKGATLRQAAHG